LGPGSGTGIELTLRRTLVLWGSEAAFTEAEMEAK